MQPFQPSMFANFFNNVEVAKNKPANNASSNNSQSQSMLVPSVASASSSSSSALQYTVNSTLFAILKTKLTDQAASWASSSITSPDSKRIRKRDSKDILSQLSQELFFIGLVLNLYNSWPVQWDSFAFIIQALNQTLQHVSKNLSELKNNPQHWRSFIQDLQRLFHYLLLIVLPLSNPMKVTWLLGVPLKIKC